MVTNTFLKILETVDRIARGTLIRDYFATFNIVNNSTSFTGLKVSLMGNERINNYLKL